MAPKRGKKTPAKAGSKSRAPESRAKPATKSKAAVKTKKGKLPNAAPKQKPRSLREIEDEEDDELEDDASLPGEDKGVEEENADDKENAEDLPQGDESDSPAHAGGTRSPASAPNDGALSPPPSRVVGAPSTPAGWVTARAHSLSPRPDGADSAPITSPPPVDSLSRAGAAKRMPIPTPPPDSSDSAHSSPPPETDAEGARCPSRPPDNTLPPLPPVVPPPLPQDDADGARCPSPPPDDALPTPPPVLPPPPPQDGAEGARSPSPPPSNAEGARSLSPPPGNAEGARSPSPPPGNAEGARSPSPPPGNADGARSPSPPPDNALPPPRPPHWVAVEKARQRAEELHAEVQALEAEEERVMRRTRDAMYAARQADASEDAQEAASALLREVREAAARVNDARDQAFAAQASWRNLEKEAKEKDAAPPPLSAEERTARDANIREVGRNLIYGSQDDDDEDDDDEEEDGEYDSETHRSRHPQLPKQPKTSRARPGKLDPVAVADREAKRKGRRRENKEIDRRIQENEEERQKLCLEIATQYHRKPDDIRARFPDHYGLVKKRRKVSLHNALKHEISKVWAEQGRFLNKQYNFADLAAEAKKPEWIEVGIQRGEELIAALQKLHDEEDFGTRATNNGAAADVNIAFNNCVNILRGVKARTGAVGIVVIARVHVNDNNEPKVFGSGNALDFLKDGATQFAQDFEMWAVKEKKAEIRTAAGLSAIPSKDIRKSYRDLMETSLKKVINKPINYKDYVGKMMLQNGVYIKGWPFDTVYALSSHAEMETVVQGLEDGSITWSRISAPEKPRVQKWVKWMEKKGKWHGPSRKARADKRGEQVARDEGSTPGHSPIYPPFMSKKVRALALAAGTLYDMDGESSSDEEEDAAPQPKPKAKAVRRKEREVDEEEEADEPQPKSKAEAVRASKKRKEREVDEEEAEAEEPAKKGKQGKSVKFTKSAVKVGPPRGILKNAAAGPSKPSSTKKRARTESSDSDESGGDFQGGSDSDEAPPPKKNKTSDRAQPRRPPPHPVTGHPRRALPFSAVPKGRKGKK
ncbi:hypothetical protein GGX14DRAFT_559013 [Mycena pura]|uniref:Uncharacterized protein n=1 Tax=Mycena pura TaxID=153505 RepID=A0AAD6VSN3_9AGAR|nr:hypothetical protein GGX14DRAFT_559013 [Mycena pura]